MTPNDANKLLALAKANYSYAFRNMTNQEKVMLVQSWSFALQDIQADIVMLAFMQLLATSKWLPTVAEIRERVKGLYYDAAYSSDDFLGHKDTMGKRAKQYIAEHTYKLRGDGPPELTLDTILHGAYKTAIGSGKMDFATIEGQEKYFLTEKEGDCE